MIDLSFIKVNVQVAWTFPVPVMEGLARVATTPAFLSICEVGRESRTTPRGMAYDSFQGFSFMQLVFFDEPFVAILCTFKTGPSGDA